MNTHIQFNSIRFMNDSIPDAVPLSILPFPYLRHFFSPIKGGWEPGTRLLCILFCSLVSLSCCQWRSGLNVAHWAAKIIILSISLSSPLIPLFLYLLLAGVPSASHSSPYSTSCPRQQPSRASKWCGWMLRRMKSTIRRCTLIPSQHSISSQ